MNNRLKRGTMLGRYITAVLLALVFTTGSIASGQKKRVVRTTATNAAAVTPETNLGQPLFSTFPVDQSQTIDLRIDEDAFDGLQSRDKLDQIRDWLLFTIISDSGLSIEQANRILFDVPASRRGHMRSVGSFEYGPTRSKYLGDGHVVALIPQAAGAARIDQLAQIVDEHRKNTAEKPSRLTIFDYEIHLSGHSAVITKRAEMNPQQLFSEANGYFEARITNKSDLERFLQQVDDLTYSKLDNGSLLLGGRKIKGQSYQGLRLEDVAAIWKSEIDVNSKLQTLERFTSRVKAFDTAWKKVDTIIMHLARAETAEAGIELASLRKTYTLVRTSLAVIRDDKKEKDFEPVIAAYEAVLKLVQAYNTFDLVRVKREAENLHKVKDQQLSELQSLVLKDGAELRVVSGSGFSLDPTYDFQGLSEFFTTKVEPVLQLMLRISPAEIREIKNGFTKKDIQPLLDVLARLSEAGHRSTALTLNAEIDSRYGFQEARYDGLLQGTEVGMVLFYTDLLAKLWLINFEGSIPSDEIEGFYAQTTVPISRVFQANIKTVPGTRLWFGPRSKGFQLAGEGGTALLFSRRATRIYSASHSTFSPGKEVEANAASGAILDWWDSHYDEIASHEPEYQRLNEIMKWSVLAGWLNNANQLNSLSFLNEVSIYNKNWFPNWVRQKPHLRFQQWDEVHFHPAGYKGRPTETLPLLTTEFTRFNEPRFISGGVSLGTKETFSSQKPLTRSVPLDQTTWRSDLDYGKVRANRPNLPSSVQNTEGTQWQFNRSRGNLIELIAKRKQETAFRDASSEFSDGVTVKRSMSREPQSLTIETQVGGVPTGKLKITRTPNGFQLGQQSRAIDAGHALTRRLSTTKNPESLLASAPEVREAYRLPGDVEYLIKIRSSEKWLRVGLDNGGPKVPADWHSRVAALGNDAQVLRLKWISEPEARVLMRRGQLVRSSSSEGELARVDAFLGNHEPNKALGEIETLPVGSLSQPDVLLRSAVANLQRNQSQPAYDSLRQIFNTKPDVENFFTEVSARLAARKLLPQGDLFLPVQNGQQITLVYRTSRLGKPLSANEAKTLNVSESYLFIEDNPGLINLDWSPGMESRTLQQVIAKDLGEVVELPREEIARFRPAFIKNGDGTGAAPRTFRSVRETGPGSPLRMSQVIPCVDSDNDDRNRRNRDDRSILCVNRKEKDQRVYVVVAR